MGQGYNVGRGKRGGVGVCAACKAVLERKCVGKPKLNFFFQTSNVCWNKGVGVKGGGGV